MADWITGPRVLASIARGTEVLLYLSPTGDLIGFGSIGESIWAFPDPHDEKLPVSIVPGMAVHSAFQGTTVSDGRKASEAILSDLMARAGRLAPEILVLTVHEDNHRAKHLYELAGFQYLKGKRHSNLRMFLRIK